MPGDISRDFAQSLSKLHNQVNSMESKLKQQQKQIEDLTTLLKSTNDQAVQKQSKRARNAALTKDQEDIRTAAASAVSTTDEEMLRQLAYQPQAQTYLPSVRQDLLDNFIAATEPFEVVKIEIDEPVPKPSIKYQPYQAPTIEDRIRQSQAIAMDAAYRI
jgi:uncharacterized protein (UPF0147 family)